MPGAFGVLVGGEGVFAVALADTGLEPPPLALRQEPGQGGSADRADRGHGLGRVCASGGGDLVGGGVEEHGGADAVRGQARPGCGQVGGDAHQGLVDREQGVDLLLEECSKSARASTKYTTTRAGSRRTRCSRAPVSSSTASTNCGSMTRVNSPKRPGAHSSGPRPQHGETAEWPGNGTSGTPDLSTRHPRDLPEAPSSGPHTLDTAPDP